MEAIIIKKKKNYNSNNNDLKDGQNHKLETK